jgi:lysophospholipase L1-like esterase
VRLRVRVALGVLAAGALLIGIGAILAHVGRDAICDPALWEGRRWLKRCTRYVFPTLRAGSTQVGSAVMVLGLVGLLVERLAPERRTAFWTAARHWSLRVAVVLAIGFLTGEVALRVLYWDGISFGGHMGPLVARFERDFVLNRHDGPSRGPEVEGPKPAGWKRVLIQGDSITWGQGVKPESALYSQQLLERLRARDPHVEMAVLAAGGREIDGHLEQIRRHGAEIDPDLIIYQWFLNDIELDKSGRPTADLPWRRLFFHPVLASGSALWFFLDHAFSQLWPTSRTYAEYIHEDCGPGTENWRNFEEQFAAWAREAHALTPRVLVALYPRVNPPDEVLFLDLHEQVRALAHAQGLETIELIDAFRGLEGDYGKLWASPYDAHPSALAHRLIAEALDERLRSSWPELFGQGSSGGSPAS